MNNYFRWLQTIQIFVLFTATILVLIISPPAPASATLSCSPNGSGCVNWYFINQGIPSDQPPSEIIIDADRVPYGIISWAVHDEQGNGMIGFQTSTQKLSGDPRFWLENCASRGNNVFGFVGSGQYKANLECTVTAHDGKGEGTLQISIGVTDGQTTPFQNGKYQPTNSYNVKVRVIPEFGETSVIVLIISLVTITAFSGKSKLNITDR